MCGQVESWVDDEGEMHTYATTTTEQNEAHYRYIGGGGEQTAVDLCNITSYRANVLPVLPCR